MMTAPRWQGFKMKPETSLDVRRVGSLAMLRAMPRASFSLNGIDIPMW